MTAKQICELCGEDPVCCKCVMDGLTAKAEATVAHENWRKRWAATEKTDA